MSSSVLTVLIFTFIRSRLDDLVSSMMVQGKKKHAGAGVCVCVTWSVKHLPHKCEDLGSGSQHPWENRMWKLLAIIQVQDRWKQEDSPELAGQPIWPN